MDFSSDTSAPAHPKVLEALVDANQGTASSYGADPQTVMLNTKLTALLGTDDFDVWPCASGTASNALALSVLCRPTQAILCHSEAHIERDERGAPEFFTGGGKLQLLPGQAARIDETALRDALAKIDPSFVHETPAAVLSLTNLTECGTAYTPETIAHYAALAKATGLSVHLDGARLANVLAHQGTSLADMSWRSGVDVLCLGLTKTGALGCELIILFGDTRARFGELKARAKRAGHMPPKLRYLSAQANALLSNDLWITLAAAANRQARMLSSLLCSQPGVSLAYPVEGNEVFAILPDGLAAYLEENGAKFYPWPGGSYRFVCNWATMDADIEALRICLAAA
ncbi:MAG: beta-eliminating lyase-related protein [Pseudomonadota bacterium]